MQIIFSTPDEREIIRRLCDDLAAKCGPLYKNAHVILKSAMHFAATEKQNPNAGIKPAYPKG